MDLAYHTPVRSFSIRYVARPYASGGTTSSAALGKRQSVGSGQRRVFSLDKYLSWMSRDLSCKPGKEATRLGGRADPVSEMPVSRPRSALAIGRRSFPDGRCDLWRSGRSADPEATAAVAQRVEPGV